MASEFDQTDDDGKGDSDHNFLGLRHLPNLGFDFGALVVGGVSKDRHWGGGWH